MDEHYDYEHAAQYLEAYAALQRETNGTHLADFGMGRIITQFTQPKCWKITEDTVEPVEVSFIVQGIVTLKDLPPIADVWSPKYGKQRFLRQSIQITGLGTPTFQACVDSLADIDTSFSRSIPEGNLQERYVDTYMGHPCLNFGTRYFTSRSEDRRGEALPFGPLVDPHGTLTRMTNDKFFHGHDNQVLYYRLKGHDINNTIDLENQTFEPVSPAQFRHGDVVEVQTTILAALLSEAKIGVFMQMRSIALLNSRFMLEALVARRLSTMSLNQDRLLLKAVGKTKFGDRYERKRSKDNTAKGRMEGIQEE